MQARLGALAIALIGAMALTGCASKDPHLMNLHSDMPGPDEFSILPSKPLEMPKSTTELPPPTPGGTNRTDQTPVADAVTALGGKASALKVGAIPASDQALMNDVSRFGMQPGIRKELAAEDLRFRQHSPPKPFYKLFGISSYLRAYKGMSLDQYKALEYWRARGVRTESAPPENTK
ncbi:DUF3035 domain-containing protein [Acidimangrovimonas sediminis]|uniref:DUF3035 domain-containing protein n=1 Tax=Acidimangrovimonas sediminis TaxID=2056283 RepID=UPI000C80ADE7|nr:DUF3035 domain-containing protein [Acidimangrovimonas sediminis]